jgi:hypothetical protein
MQRSNIRHIIANSIDKNYLFLVYKQMMTNYSFGQQPKNTRSPETRKPAQERKKIVEKFHRKLGTKPIKS